MMLRPYFLLLSLFISPAFAMGNKPSECTDYTDTMRVKVGETEFRIPVDYRPIFIGKNIPELQQIPIETNSQSPKSKWVYCQSKEAPPFEVDGWGITLPDSQNPPTKYLNEFPTLSKTVISVQEGAVDPVNLFCKKKREIETQIDEWEPYEKSKHFFEGLGPIGKDGYNYYLSRKPLLFGLPTLISCTPEKNVTPWCDFYFNFSPATYVRIQFSKSDIPPEKWEVLFKEIPDFFKQVMVNPPINTSFESCNKKED